MEDSIIKKVKKLLVIIKKIMSENNHAPENELIVTENPNASGEEPSEVRYASIEDQKIREEATKIPDYSKGIKVIDSEGGIVTIFTEEKDGKDYIANAEAYAAEYGYTVGE